MLLRYRLQPQKFRRRIRPLQGMRSHMDHRISIQKSFKYSIAIDLCNGY